MAAEPAEVDNGNRRWRVSRRGFLIGMGVAGTGLALGWRYGLPEARLKIAEMLDNAPAPGSIDAPPTVWFELNADNSVTLNMPKVEMGQGVHTSLAQIAAEELELNWNQLRVVSANTSLGLKDSFGTGGSSTVSSLYTPLREAAATLRMMLEDKAAQVWGLEPHEVTASNGELIAQNGERMSYGELAEVSDWEIPENPPTLKAKRDFRYIGLSAPRVDFADKLTGRAKYGYDMRLPGMLYGAVARPPIAGAKLLSATAGAAREMDGVKHVVIENGFAGVVATTRAKAYKGVEALKLEWDSPQAVQQDELLALTTVGEGGVVIQREGNAARELKTVTLAAEYRTPFAAHAHLEPQAALVNVEADKITAYVSTQAPTLVRNEIAELLKRDQDSVELTATYLGGGFGRRLNVEVALEAARLSNAAGVPVHVGWNRTEEFRHGYVRPPTHSRLKAQLNEDGSIHAAEHRQASGDVAFPFFPAIAQFAAGADFGAWRGATLHYGNIPHRRTVAQRVKLPVRTGWWRGLGLLANTFAVESFMDELAHAASADPFEYRLAHLGASENGERFRRVLQAAAEAADWGKPAPEGRARGIACSTDVNTICAQIAEVSVENGNIRVHKMTAAIDPGLIINPDGVRAQTQGAIVMGLSSAFLEQLTFKDGLPEAANFDRYPLLTIKETPDIEVVLLESGDEPFGMGEPPLGPVAAATANAVFALTGERLRALPLKLA